MARRTSTLRTAIEELGLNINPNGLTFREGQRKIRILNNTQTLSKTITVSDYENLEEALEVADAYNKHMRTYNKLPGKRERALIELGLDPTSGDYRGITYCSPNNKAVAYWLVRQWDGKSGKFAHKKYFAFDSESKVEAIEALSNATKYQQDIMGETLLANPRTHKVVREKIVGRGKSGKILKNVQFTKTAKGTLVRVQSDKVSKTIGVSNSYADFKRDVMKAVKARNEANGLSTSRKSLEPAISSLRDWYLEVNEL